MKIICSATVANESARELMVDELNIYGFVPLISGNTVSIEHEGRFIGTIVKLLGVFDAVEAVDRSIEILEVENEQKSEKKEKVVPHDLW